METKDLTEIETRTRYMKLFEEADLQLQSGGRIGNITAAYQTYGMLNEAGDNAVLICHALTGSAHAAGIVDDEELRISKEHDFLHKYNKMNYKKQGWWDALIGKGKAFDTDKYFVICINFLGSCYGSTGPTSINEATGNIYGREFPVVTIRDMVNVQYEVVKRLGVNEIVYAAGGSLGGMQVLEWAIMYPQMVKNIIAVATSARHSAWSVALNEAARNAIMNDPVWNGGSYDEQPANGFGLARKIAMLSYRSNLSFNGRFERERIMNGTGNYFDEKNIFQVESYLNYQGEKLVKRFDANSYLTISRAMDLHDVTVGRGSLAEVLGSISAGCLSIGIDTDILYPAAEQRELSTLVKGSAYREVKSLFGHDAFLIEFEQMERFIRGFVK